MVPDILRVFLFAIGSLGIGLAIVVLYPYLRKIVVCKRKSIKCSPIDYHVALIAISWILLATYALVETFERFGHPVVPPQFILRVAGLTTGITALVFMLRHVRSKSEAQVKHQDRVLKVLQAQVDLIRRQNADRHKPS